jgi:hypothetical protein
MINEEWIEFLEVVQGTICRGIYVGDLANPKFNHLETMRPDRLIEECMRVAGKEAKMPRPVLDTDSSDDYAKALRESPDWEEILPVDNEDFYPLLKDHDLLTWAYSEDGTGECNGLPGLDGGNTSCGFLIQASGEYPTVSHPQGTGGTGCSGGVYSLKDCMGAKERDGLKGKLIYIHRRVG